jgi:Transcription initiation factor TFIID component TAF4 family
LITAIEFISLFSLTAAAPQPANQSLSPGSAPGTNGSNGAGKLNHTTLYQIAWKQTAQHAIQLYPDAKDTILQLHTRIQLAASQETANPQGLQNFANRVRQELATALGTRAWEPLEYFKQKYIMLSSRSTNAEAHHTSHENVQQQAQQAQHAQQGQQSQQQAQGQQQQYNTAQQQYAQQQQAQQAQANQQQQYYQQQQMMAAQQQQQQGGPQQQHYPPGNAPPVQTLYNPNVATTAASAGMYAHQQQPGMMMNPLATTATGMPQMQQFAGTNNPMAVNQQQQQHLGQQGFQAGSPVPPPTTLVVGGGGSAAAPQGGKPPKAPKGKRAAEGDAGGGGAGDGEGKPAPKRAKAAAAPRKKKAQDSDADEDAADKIKVGDELLVDLQAETDAAMEGIDSRRKRQLPTVPGGQSWDDGYQYLSAWRLTNEVLLQRKEKMPGTAALTGPAGVVDFLEPSMLRALQLGFTSHAAEVMRRAAHAAKHRASSSAAQRRPEFISSGEDARRGLGDIRRAAEKIAADKAAVEREELMKKAQSKRADEETRERAQKARAEMAGQQQASAANKAIAATLGGGKGAKWSKWSGAGAAATAAAGKGAKGKGGKGETIDRTNGDGGDGGVEGGNVSKTTIASARSRGDLGTAASAGGTNNATTNPSTDASALESTDIQLQDLIVALQQDPTYCKSMLLYRLLNGMN